MNDSEWGEKKMARSGREERTTVLADYRADART